MDWVMSTDNKQTRTNWVKYRVISTDKYQKDWKTGSCQLITNRLERTGSNTGSSTDKYQIDWNGLGYKQTYWNNRPTGMLVNNRHTGITDQVEWTGSYRPTEGIRTINTNLRLP